MKYYDMPTPMRRKLLVRLTAYLERKLGYPTKPYDACETPEELAWWYANAKVDGYPDLSDVRMPPMIAAWMDLALDPQL